MVGVSNDVIKRPTMSVVLTVFTAVSAIKKWFWQYMSNVEVFSDHKPLRQYNLVRWLQNMYNQEQIRDKRALVQVHLTKNLCYTEANPQ